MTVRRVVPSGAQWEIRYGDQRVVAVEVGAGLRSYTVGERPVLDGFGVDEKAGGARGQTLIPWPNRLRDGRFSWRGDEHQVAITEPSKGTAIHGLVRWANWTLAEHGESHVTLEHTLHAQMGWPWPLLLRMTYRLDQDGLTARVEASNASAQPCPYATGHHPYLSVGTPTIDPATLRVPAATWYPTDDQQIPTGRQAVDGTPYDFREPRRLEGAQVDFAYTDLLRDPDGRARVVLALPDGPSSTLWLDEAYGYVEIFTADTLEPARRRTGLGVEPMTCAPNALQSGDGLVTLEPGQTHVAQWGITPG